jgi:peroxiredoxin
MSDGKDDTLAASFAALEEERERSWPPERLADNRAQRRALVAAFDPTRIAQPGDRLDPYALLDDDGGAVTLDELTRDGPAVLIFFRFAGCPACNIALPYYDRQLRPALAAAGIALAAVSPQVPGRVGEIGRRHGLGFPVLSDPDNGLARRLGISFLPATIPAGPPPAGWIGELTGTGSWELPQPTVLVIDRGRVVRSIAVSPDWLDRPEAEDILAALHEDAVRRAA